MTNNRVFASYVEILDATGGRSMELCLLSLHYTVEQLDSYDRHDACIRSVLSPSLIAVIKTFVSDSFLYEILPVHVVTFVACRLNQSNVNFFHRSNTC